METLSEKIRMGDTEISLADPVLTDEMVEVAEWALRDEYWLRGASVDDFEDDFSEFIGVEHAVAVDSGTRALYLALRSLGVGDGQTVLTTPATFVATANAIVMTGARPRFVDVSLDTYTIDHTGVEDALRTEPNVGAILPVHLYGYPVDVEGLKRIAGDVPILSDACQAHGASRTGIKVGARSSAAAFSFYPSKNMTVAGDGGMVVTDDRDVADTVRTLRDVGRESEPYRHEVIAPTARMNTVNAAIGRRQLNHLTRWNDRRREFAAKYAEELAGVDDLVLPPEDDGEVRSCWYLYVVRTERRDDLAAHLGDRGIETGYHYPIPVHLQPPYRRMGYEEGMFPNAERWAREVLSLPIHPSLTTSQVEYVAETIRAFFDGGRR